MEPQPRKYTLKEILFLPIGCALQAPYIPVLILLGTILFASFIAYKSLNFDPFHLWTRNYPDYSLSEDLSLMRDPNGYYWEISYEGNPGSTFTGIVRHISPDEEPVVPMLTYDILVTNGDYADPKLVRTTVVNHMFAWQGLSSTQPQGKINLLHTVAKNYDVFAELRDIQNGDIVQIRGIEIYKIDAYDPMGNSLGYWIDQGCNTILVTEVEIQD
jgi:hypothetical protein